MTINYPNREIHLQPNSHFKEEFDYAYSGLGIYYVNGKIVVEDVIENSPADKANFRINDEILAVNRNFSLNMQVYKNMLQKPYETIKVLIRRDGILKELTLNTISIR
jgi:C-terminal processing protease CtpA/Prc